MRGAYSKILSSDGRYVKSIPLFRHFLATYPEAKATNYLLEKFYSFIERCAVRHQTSFN